MGKSDKTKNAIGTIISEYNFDGICAADCSDGHVIFNLGFSGSPFNHIEEHIPDAKIRFKTTIKRGGPFECLNNKTIKDIDNKEHIIDSCVDFEWVIQHVKLHSKLRSSECKFVKGSLSVLEKLSENKDFVRWNLYGKRYRDSSSFYDENTIYLYETVICYFKRTDCRYNRHKDEFAKGCLKLGLDFNKYSYLNSPEMSLEKTMRNICNDLGYNLLAII